MREVISNTSPLLYTYRIGVFEWLPRLFGKVWIPSAVVRELREGIQKGYETPEPKDHQWLKIVEPTSIPSEWLSSDLGRGELAAMALALENPDRVVLLDDMLARNIAAAAGLKVWGTLKILLEAKAQGLTEAIAPLIFQLERTGMWLSDDIRARILRLAGEKSG